MTSTPPPLYPLFLKLEERDCLVVGGGAIAAQKAKELLEAGARVRLVAPEVADETVALQEAFPDTLRVASRRFAPDDIGAARVVIAATSDRAVNERVAERARAHRALVNVVDVPPLCDFYAGGVVRRGPLTVVVGTSGASPSLARRVRQRIEEVLAPGLGPLARALGAARPRLLARFPDFKARAGVLDAFVARALSRLEHDTDDDDVARWIDEELLGPGAPDEGP